MDFNFSSDKKEGTKKAVVFEGETIKHKIEKNSLLHNGLKQLLNGYFSGCTTIGPIRANVGLYKSMGSASATNIISSCTTHVSISQNYDKFVPKFQSFKQKKETHFVNLGLPINSRSFQKIEGGIASCCKRNELIDFEERKSANEVRKEIEQCYKLIHRLGRGVIYLGSARPGSNHPHYTQALELSRKVASLLDCTTWTGAGPGLMDAAIQGALQAGKPVGGFKIQREAGQWSTSASHPYLPSDTYLTCRFFSARKHGFVDAAVRNSPSDRTAVIALPGGIGTLDEMFEILALVQLQRIGSQLPVPFLLMNFDDYYSKLLDFFDECERWGNLAKGEVEPLWKVCSNSKEAVAYLARFYDLSLTNEELEEQETKIM